MYNLQTLCSKLRDRLRRPFTLIPLFEAAPQTPPLMFFSVDEIDAIAGRVEGRNHFSIFSASTSHHGAERGGGAPECDAVDVEEVTDAAPALAEAEVAAFSVHDFQHTDIMPRDEVQRGQEFVRPLPSKCVIQFEDDDVDIPDGVRALAGSGQALDTEA